MGFFDEEGDDPFDSIVREFLGGSGVSRANRKDRFIRGENEDRNIDYVEDDSYVYLVFELPGYNEKDLEVDVLGSELEITAIKKDFEGIQGYLHQKLGRGLQIKKKLPSIISPKKFTHTMRNGILEIVFLKKDGGKK